MHHKSLLIRLLSSRLQRWTRCDKRIREMRLREEREAQGSLNEVPTCNLSIWVSTQQILFLPHVSISHSHFHMYFDTELMKEIKKLKTSSVNVIAFYLHLWNWNWYMAAECIYTAIMRYGFGLIWSASVEPFKRQTGTYVFFFLLCVHKTHKTQWMTLMMVIIIRLFHSDNIKLQFDTSAHHCPGVSASLAVVHSPQKVGL